MDPITSSLIRAIVQDAGSSVAKSAVQESYTALKDLIRNKFEEKENNRIMATSDSGKGGKRNPLEAKREDLFIKLNELHYDILLNVTQKSFLERTVPILFEQIIQLYEGKTEQELRIIEMILGQIEGSLNQYKKMLVRRSHARIIAMLVTILALTCLGLLMYWGSVENGPDVNSVLPIISIPLPVLVWSAIGSFTAILYRFNNSGDIELQDPLRWLFTRPITGVVMGTITFFIIKLGLVSVSSGEGNAVLSGNELIWLIAFLSGFSDRFSDSLLHSLVGRFGGNDKEALVTIDNNYPAITSSISEILAHLKTVPKIEQTVSQKNNQEKMDNDLKEESQPADQAENLEQEKAEGTSTVSNETKEGNTRN